MIGKLRQRARRSARAAGFCAIVLLASALFSCAILSSGKGFDAPTYTGPARSFQTSFEFLADFSGFYIVPQGDYGSSHDLSTEQVRDGSKSHKAWIIAANDTDNDSHFGYKPHRAYPTVQLQKTPGGIYRTPCLISLYVWLDMTLANKSPNIDDWFSFVTLTPDPSDSWARTVLVNIEHDGYIHLMHVPNQGQQNFVYQNTTLLFPFGEWVRLDVYIDFSATSGRAIVWQNQTRLSEALVNGGSGGLAQAHFGLYASAAIASGTIYNDKLRIQEVADRAEAEALVAAAW